MSKSEILAYHFRKKTATKKTFNMKMFIFKKMFVESLGLGRFGN